MKQTFTSAARSHDAVKRAANEDLAAARSLWDAITTGEASAGSVGAAVVDAAPIELAGTIASLPTAASYAFAAQWDAFKKAPKELTPFQAREVARAGWKQVQERAAIAGDIKNGLGADASDAWAIATVPDAPNDQAALAFVREVAKLAGRMYAALRGAKSSKVHGAPEEVYNVELGSDVGRLLPSELAQLSDDDLAILPMARMVEKRALQYAVRGKAPAGGGPLVLAIDESGSMKADASGYYEAPLPQQHRRVWAAAAAVALTRVAHDAKRPVVVVHFSSSTEVRDLRPGDTQGILAMTVSHLGGGTLIGQALDEAARQVDRLAKKGARGADVVLVTDGVDEREHEQSSALSAVAATGARLWLVGIETKVSGPIRKAAVRYVQLGEKDLNSVAGAVAIGAAAA